MGQEIEIIETIILSKFAVLILLTIVCVSIYRLYTSEKLDRKDAWKSYNDLARETNKVLNDLSKVMEVIKNELSHKK
jgi:hypothetical protein